MLLSFTFLHVGSIAPENGGYNAERFLTVVVKDPKLNKTVGVK
jgi:hypothetical protein